MRRIITKSLLLLVSQLCVNAQITTKQWTGSVDAEFSFGLVGYARDDSYKSVGVAASYGLLLNDHYIVGLGTKPNYVFSDGDYDGYFQPVYAEFKYQSIPNTNQFYYFGVARLGYSPISQKGMYAHIGVGFDYKKWNFGYGISYQFTRFKEDYSNEIYYNTYNMVFGTLSVGYRF